MIFVQSEVGNGLAEVLSLANLGLHSLNRLAIATSATTDRFDYFGYFSTILVIKEMLFLLPELFHF